MRNPLFDLTGKTAVITGSTKGIGLAIARAMGQAGANVVISSRKADKCEEVAEMLRGEGLEATPIACHIGKKEQLQELVDKTKETYGKIDSLVCNAAANPYYGPMSELPEDAFDKVIETNVKANWRLCNMVLPDMAERRDGSVIIVSSIGGFRGSENLGIYGISKAADFQLTRNLAVEWGLHNIRANCIAPGLVRTDFARALWEDPERLAAREATTPLRRIGEPVDIAGAAVFLAAPAGAWLTGQVITVDGGVTIAG